MDLLELMRVAIETLERLEIEYAIVGSFASGVWGETRTTHDIDIVIQLDVFDTVRLCAEFPLPDYYVSLPAAQEAVERGGQFNVIDNNSGNKIDFMVATETMWSSTQLLRRKKMQILSAVPGDVASPEDVILGKLIYYKDGGSEKHLRDIASMFRVSGELIDRHYLNRHAALLDVVDELRVVMERADRPD